MKKKSEKKSEKQLNLVETFQAEQKRLIKELFSVDFNSSQLAAAYQREVDKYFHALTSLNERRKQRQVDMSKYLIVDRNGIIKKFPRSK